MGVVCCITLGGLRGDVVVFSNFRMSEFVSFFFLPFVLGGRGNGRVEVMGVVTVDKRGGVRVDGVEREVNEGMRVVVRDEDENEDENEDEDEDEDENEDEDEDRYEVNDNGVFE
jgi:hypothetical protein